ncbi:MAG: hypothetical protein IT318_00650 [Anaerolineales bacterium]|nr:hypothetical protein [Anaerolineales bacterium]
MYAANSAGPLAVGWLGPRLGHPRLFIATALLSLPAAPLAGRVTALWQLMLLTSIL